jgi:hypothetical protein
MDRGRKASGVIGKNRQRREDKMKRKIGLLVVLSLLLTTYGCFVETRDEGYHRHHEENGEREYRNHEGYRDDGYERDRDRDEYRDREDEDYGDQR